MGSTAGLERGAAAAWAGIRGSTEREEGALWPRPVLGPLEVATAESWSFRKNFDDGNVQ